jgi:hypothetical protein
MSARSTFSLKRRRAGSLAILLVGLTASLAIYLTARPPAPNPLGYEPEDSKQYLRNMEVYGGRSNLIASELREFLASLWHGKRLALTVAVITLIAAWAYHYFSIPLSPESHPGAAGPGNPAASG